MVFLEDLAKDLMEELNCETVFTIPIFGGIDVSESVVVTWIIMAVLVLVAIILTRNMFSNIYEKKGYESRLLSRTTEDAVTVTSVLIPWNTCGMTQATILSESTLTYLPYCFFNLISPLMSILIAATGYKIIKKTENNPG